MLQAMLSLLDVLNRAVKRSKPDEATQASKSLFGFLLVTLDLRRQNPSNVSSTDLAAVEAASLSVFLSLVMKLSEVSFKPLLLRAIDWAIVDLSGSQKDAAAAATVDRRVTLFKLFGRLLSQLRVSL